MSTPSDWDDGLPGLDRLMRESGGQPELDPAMRSRIIAGGRKLRRRQKLVQAGSVLGVVAVAVVGTSVVATGRDSDSKDVVISSTASPSPTGPCKRSVKPGMPPRSPLSFVAEGHVYNEWTVPFDGDEATVRFMVTQLPETKVTRLTFRLSPFDKPSDDNVIRTFEGARDLDPGKHEITLTWDGKDDNGRLVAPGRYRITAQAETLTPEVIRCTDGRTIEEPPKYSSKWGWSLGSFRYRKPS